MIHGRIEIEAGKLVVRCPPHVAQKLRRYFGGAQRYKAGVFTMAATPACAFDLKWFKLRHPLDVDDAARGAFDALVAAHERKLEAIAELDMTGYVPREFELELPPREYQRIAADLALRTGALLVADDLGLGKTVVAICALSAPGVLPAVIVTPTHLSRQWEVQIHKFAPKLRVHRIRRGQPYDFHDIKVERGPDGKRRLIRGNPVPDVVVINFHKLHGWVDRLASMARTVVFDEVQELRHEGTRKYDSAVALAAGTDLKIGLSATPIYNYGAEIFAVVNALAPDQLGTYKEFYDEWCNGAPSDSVDDRRKAKVADPAALGTYLRECGLMIRRTRREVGRELPALTIVRHAVEADPQSIEKASADVAELAQRVLDRIGTGLERMQAGGELDYRLRQATGIAKAGAVSDFVRLLVEGGERVLLFGWHHEVYSLWRSAFDRQGSEIPYAMYTGQESDAQKAASVERFIKGEAKVLIISLRSGSGLDGLQAMCRTVVIGELDWSPQVIRQCIGRAHRDGQTEPVVAYVLVADEGSDPVISDVLGVKDAQSEGILNPDTVGIPELTGASTDHIRKLAEDVIRRRAAAQQNRRTG